MKINEQKAQERLDELQPKAQEVTERIENLREQYAFESTNVKLHDVAFAIHRGYKGYSTEQLEKAFDWFCLDELAKFDDFLDGLGLQREYIGRTSSFYIVPLGVAEYTATETFYGTSIENNSADKVAILDAIEQAYVGSDKFEAILQLAKSDLTLRELFGLETIGFRDFEEDYNEALEDGEMEDILDDLDNAIEDIGNELSEVVVDTLETVQEAYDYVNETKDNQVECFEDTLKDIFDEAI